MTKRKRPFFTRLDRCVTDFLPLWVIRLVCALVFGVLVWAFFTFLFAFIMMDWAELWTWWTRMWLVFWVLLFRFILMD